MRLFCVWVRVHGSHRNWTATALLALLRRRRCTPSSSCTAAASGFLATAALVVCLDLLEILSPASTADRASAHCYNVRVLHAGERRAAWHGDLARREAAHQAARAVPPVHPAVVIGLRSRNTDRPRRSARAQMAQNVVIAPSVAAWPHHD
jgi:hypothetical protein